MLEDRILFIDDEAIIIDKPAGLPVDEPRRGGDSVVGRAEELRMGKATPVPMHRLDQDTSGCLLLARTPDARRKFQMAFEKANAVKYYLAVIDGEVAGEQGEIDLPLGKRSTAEKGWWIEPDPKGQPARTSWQVLERRGTRTLVRLEPHTGRTHQIRVHARAQFGAGIVGDPVYGSGDGPMLLHAIRLSLAHGDSIFYAAHAVAPLPDHWGDWRVDPAAVAAHEAELKSQLSYADWSRDLDKIVYADLDRPIFAEARRAGLALFPVGEAFLQRAYIERGAVEPLVASLSGCHAATNPLFERLPPLLIEAGRTDLLERLWRSVARKARAKWFSIRSEAYRRQALATYDKALHSLGAAGATAAAAELQADRAMVKSGQVPPPPELAETREMDNDFFWELISQTRAATVTADEQIALIGDRLAAMTAQNIRRFATIFSKLMKKLYHWNAWALAYAACGGCSDTSFREFRTWLILQADQPLIDLAVTDPGKAALSVPGEPPLPFNEIAEAIESAHLTRAGKTYELPLFELEEPRGKEWDEDRFDEQFPALTACYER